ncbi:flagellar motor protein MotB [Curtobacterium sp. MCBD17_040]|uniref:OmpA/MotB family protein n=1 Tax=Curtobacterium sp. MCBD17_040 TaxID=2175674 RepID=UPI000DA83936|nr:flagellar motor protein MotB [Curtobacterium sp. MCBD17_040]WIB65586.1 flagellar motor protein MotB [Curtobacterium sp. MCBD17_040]
MSSGKGRRRGGGGGGDGAEEHPDERWMASYMDMVTVLMCTFIVLFSMSSINAHKFDQLKNSLQTGFGVQKSQKVDTAKGVIVPKDVKKSKTPSVPTPLQLAQTEVQNFQKLQSAINAQLTAKGLQHDVQFSIDSRGLTIGLVGDSTFFDSNQDTLTGTAQSIIDVIGPVLRPTAYKLSIEGHADKRPPQAPYATNWDLAAERAVSVLRRLDEQNGIADTRTTATSYGSSDATAPGNDAAALSHDRRVDIVVLSGQNQDVRNLIPKVLAAEKSH